MEAISGNCDWICLHSPAAELLHTPTGTWYSQVTVCRCSCFVLRRRRELALCHLGLLLVSRKVYLAMVWSVPPHSLQTWTAALTFVLRVCSSLFGQPGRV